MSNKAFLLVSVFLIVVSCQKDFVSGAGEGDKSIVCRVTISGTYDTKSVEVDSTSLATSGNTFRLDAWLEAENRGKAWPEFDADPHYIKSAIMKYNGSRWQSETDTVFWTNKIQTNFWAQYPETLPGRGELTWTAAVTDTITDIEEREPSFTYDMAAYLDTLMTSSGNASHDTPDLLVAYARKQYEFKDGSAKNKLEFHFAHVLSAIKIERGQTSSDYVIDSLWLTGVYTKGTCELTGSSDVSVSAKWDVDSLSNYYTIRQTGITDFYDNKEYIFLIPQTLTSTAKIKAFITTPTHECFEREGYLEGCTWRPGFIYKYKLTFDQYRHDLNVTVNETDGRYKLENGVWNQD